MIVECIKEGFRITNKNWQVVVLKIAVAVVNLAGFFIFVGIPIFIAITSLGIDLAQAKDILPGIFENPIEVLSKYLGLVVLIFIALLIYLTVAFFLILYFFSGTLGILRNAVIDEQYKFSFASFMEEAKKIFSPLLWLFSIAFLATLSILIILGLSAGFLIYVIHAYGRLVTTFSIFVTYFFSLFGIAIFLVAVIFTAYAAIDLVVVKGRVITSFKNALTFTIDKPIAFLFYIFLFVGLIAANFILIAVGTSIRAIPLLIPYQLISYGIRSYLGVVMWSSLLTYYIKATNYPVYSTAPPTYDI